MAINLQSKVTCDVMISYNIKDIDFVRRIKATFEEQGWKVWYSDPNLDAKLNLSQKGEAILSCKVFVIVISEATAKDSHCQDELALAYISNSNIFPLGLSKFRDINPHLDGGIKLMLAKINWTFFFKEDLWKMNMPALLASMRESLIDSEGQPEDTTAEETGGLQFHGMNININFDNDNDNDNVSGEDSDSESSSSDEAEYTRPTTAATSRSVRSARGRQLRYDFWDRNFKDKSEIPWTTFRQKFDNDYKRKIIMKYSEDKLKFFLNLMYKDIFTLNKTVKRSTYDHFCEGNPDADPHRFYNRIQQYAVGYYAMHAVFNMTSTLRLTTIQNLGNFAFPAVVKGLTEMLQDEDPNIRAVATIALAKSAKSKKMTVDKIICKLDDDDRLVRESACLALGYLKAGGKSEVAVADRWRNDPIKSVREAAEIALKRMGGTLANKCMQVTNVISKEMDSLRHMEET
ncbi:uncharacterized protein LOC110464060 isoform X1 [Mizuhopecten yessoensis]|nr:uncharacterized protein LOC110464060 isoform X1 [Mizuhopecten yessoensis]XP_021374755.1 uncharacterized protein LOC110464060 isoform X1 [Mizuhopecten yessoensis]XP_021374756.1 uncharacterized protein LOC110464060 isoform X1 [Mizuhopecten yessoensis]XP_021374757.1 uncharacterized protein LOC110464060 isoform X1 [Mizuhopecten yessoensis]